MQILLEHLRHVHQLFFPDICNGCHAELLSNEHTICTQCLSEIPKTKFHQLINNPMEQKLTGRINIENATTMYYFNKQGIMQNIMHEFKYRGKKEIGVLLGRLFAKQLEDARWIGDIDTIIPVPLSKKKVKTRGYNQSEIIAQSISEYFKKPLNRQTLIRIKDTETQTHKTRLERIENVSKAFQVASENEIRNKHILLIDDIFTTGATIESCAATLLQCENVKVSIAALGYAVE